MVCSCNLYTYPMIEAGGVFRRASPEELEEIVRVLMQTLLDSAFAGLTDSTGAPPVLALLVSNTEEAITLVRELYHRDTVGLLPQAHGAGPFLGENALHILAANARLSLCGGDRCGAELGRRQRAQVAQEGAHERARGADNDDGVRSHDSLEWSDGSQAKPTEGDQFSPANPRPSRKSGDSGRDSIIQTQVEKSGIIRLYQTYSQGFGPPPRRLR